MALVLKARDYVFEEDLKIEKGDECLAEAQIKITEEEASLILKNLREEIETPQEELYKLIFKENLVDFRKKAGEYHLEQMALMVFSAIGAKMGLDKIKLAKSATTKYQNQMKNYTK